MGTVGTFLVPNFQQYRLRGFQTANSRFLERRLRMVTSVRHLFGKSNCQAIERVRSNLINQGNRLTATETTHALHNASAMHRS